MRLFRFRQLCAYNYRLAGKLFGKLRQNINCIYHAFALATDDATNKVLLFRDFLCPKYALNKNLDTDCNQHYAAEYLCLVAKFIAEFATEYYRYKTYYKRNRRNDPRTKHRLPHAVDKFRHGKAGAERIDGRSDCLNKQRDKC